MRASAILIGGVSDVPLPIEYQAGSTPRRRSREHRENFRVLPDGFIMKVLTYGDRPL
jgi:hypothetical protein